MTNDFRPGSDVKVNDLKIEKKLVECILKYREIIQQKRYLAIEERETDREQLNEQYQQLRSVKQKILDSRCYFQLAQLQKELTALFLADETTPSDRLRMLSYVVRCVCHPIVFIQGRSMLTRYPDAPAEEEKDLVVELEDEEAKPQLQTSFKTRQISPAEISRIRKELRQLLERKTAAQDLAKLSFTQAEVLSQLASDKYLPLTIDVTDAGKSGLPTTIVLKES